MKPPQLITNRRQMLQLAGGAMASGSLMPQLLHADQVQTPSATEGPFYPIPAIEKQRYCDHDLTRLSPESPQSLGDIIALKGTVKNLQGEPISGAVVEIWQTNAHGKYSHPRDRRNAPMDPNFQYWGRAIADEEGKYEFLTIRPGKYPGRTLHIHTKIFAPSGRTLTTQIYFEDEPSLNQKDGIYRRLSRAEKENVTLDFAKTSESPDIPLGHFAVILDSPHKKGVTPTME
ncbi:Intradiol ring-cleavage dioxygenase [Planctomycetales bacterium 10988]|nr:Intradiol ring-cleavage dioxygenase [Planctomycetales bacterium 10988]